MENIIFWLIITILVLSFIFDSYLSDLNVKHLKVDLPERLKNLYSKDQYLKANNYLKDKNKLANISRTFSLCLILAMLFFNGFDFVDKKIATLELSSEIHIILFFLTISFVADILDIPFQWKAIFGIEEKYGFNKTSPQIFISDKIKSYILSAIIGSILFYMVLDIYFTNPDYFWIAAWAVIMLFMVIFNFFYSSLIVPMFNKQVPLEKGELRTEIEKYASAQNFKLKNIYVIDGSKRSGKANAYFAGFGSKKRIVLYDTLIAQHSNSELVAILAHEIGHYKKHHTILGLFIAGLQMLLMLFLFNLIVKEPIFAKSIGMEPSFQSGLLVFVLLYSPIDFLINIFGNYISRKNEYAADSFAYKTTKTDDLGNALCKLTIKNLTNLNPHPLYVFFNYSHPTLIQRLDNIEKEKNTISDK